MALVLPVVRELLAEPAADAGHIVAIGDDRGRLLWVEGDSHLRDQAQTMGFAEGALWSEQRAGTNAPGTAAGHQQARADLRRRAFPRRCPIMELRRRPGA